MIKKDKGQRLLNLTPKSARDLRARLVAIVEGLPETDTVPSGKHVSFEVRQKRFGWLLEDHHDDGRLALNCRAPRGVAEQLAAHGPNRFHIPKYVGHLGWIGLWLDTSEVDWAEVEAIVVSAYRLSAPKRLSAEMDARETNKWRPLEGERRESSS